MDPKNYRIVLASKSPRRKELLTQAGISYSVVPAKGEESYTSKKPRDIVMELSKSKAIEVYNREYEAVNPAEHVSLTEDIMPSVKPLLVIGADTIVVLDNEILGKPADSTESFEMLKSLSGRTHKVYTGVTFALSPTDSNGAPCAVIDQKVPEPIVHSFYERTNVTFYDMSDEEISEYIATGDPLDKAGAYGIQGQCAIHIEKIEGDYNNVVGLPIAKLYQELKKFLDD